MGNLVIVAATAIILGNAAPALAHVGYPSRIAEKLIFGVDNAIGRFTIGLGDLLSPSFASRERPQRKWHWLPMPGPHVLSHDMESVAVAR